MNNLTLSQKLLGITFTIIAIFAFYMAFTQGKTGLSPDALIIAEAKQAEITANQQIQLWTAKKTEATKKILEANNRLASVKQTAVQLPLN